MIGLLRGTVVDRGAPGEVVVDVGGIGYRVQVGPTTQLRLGDHAGDSAGDDGGPVTLHTHLRVREDALTLYGFATRTERDCFEALLGAHGVGPSLALAILSVHPPPALRRILVEDDVDALCMVPKVGRKTAARLLVELKARLSVPDAAEAPTGTARGEVREALAGLGYTAEEVQQVLGELPDDGPSDALLKEALQRLAAAR